MALPIQPTPVLDEKETERFLKIVEKNLETPSYRRDTSKLLNAKKLAMRHAVVGPK